MTKRALFSIIENGKEKDILLPTRGIKITREEAYPAGDIVHIISGSKVYESAECYEDTIRNLIDD